MKEYMKEIEDSDWLAFLRIMEEYLPGNDAELVAKKRKELPNAFVGFYIETQLIGIAFGWPRNEEEEDKHIISLQGIAIDWDYKAKGLGSKLLQFWQQQVKKIGYEKVGVGSADGYVEHFYRKNGYHPSCYKIFDLDGVAHEYPIASMKELESFDRRKAEEQHAGNKGFLVLERSLC